MMNRRWFVLLAVTILVLAGSTGEIYSLPEGLRGGAASIDITPPVGGWLSGYAVRDKPSEGIADKLFAKAICLSDGTTEIAIVSTDLVGITGGIVSSVRRSVERQTGIPGANIMIAATHTHFGPVVKEYKFDKRPDPDYLGTLTDKLVAVLTEAHGKLAEARIGAATGEAGELVYNRRTGRTKDPEKLARSIDPTVGVIRLEKVSGDCLASIINFACHPVTGGADYPSDLFQLISADYPVHATRVIEGIEGGLCLFTLGTAGDLNPVKRGRVPRQKIGRALGGEALRRLQLLPTTNNVSLAAVRERITLPLKAEVGEKANEEFLAGRTEVISELQGIRMGDIILLALPGEVLVGIGLEIKRRSNVEKLFLVSLANDSIGYICQSEAYDDGGYEPGNGTNLARGAGEMVVEGALKIIEQLKEEG